MPKQSFAPARNKKGAQANGKLKEEIVVDVGTRSMCERAKQHKAAYDKIKKESSESATAKMILYYAVECRLKSALMKRKNIRGTEDLDDEYKNHNLTRVAKELKLPRSLKIPEQVKMKTSFGRRHGKNEPQKESQVTVSQAKVHEAWRYGKGIDENEENQLVSILEQVYDHVVD